MSSGKILLFDIDGTLITYYGELPDSTIAGIRQARENGHRAFVVTGRSRSHIPQQVEDIGFDGMICGNGAYIEVEDNILRSRTISREEVKRIVDYLDLHQLEYYIEANDGLYGSRGFEEECKRILGVISPNITYPDSMYVENVTKVNYVLKSEQDFHDFQMAFPEYKTMAWGGEGEHNVFGDCALSGIDKAEAIEELLNYLQVNKADTVAFGDAEVDIPMFQIAETSVCLGGGRKAAKEAATLVTENVECDGVWKALKQLGLI